MMKLYVLLIMFSSGLLRAQVSTIKIKSSDTINYMYLSSVKGYSLKKVMDLSNTISHNCSKDLRIYIPLDSIWVKEARKKSNKQLKIDDTLISVRWYLIKKTECMSQYCSHADDF
jgi:hypothetical protein